MHSQTKVDSCFLLLNKQMSSRTAFNHLIGQSHTIDLQDFFAYTQEAINVPII